jgi:tRNA (guanine37-N1)-methyltransferase
VKITFISLFPELIEAYFGKGILKRAQDNNVFSVDVVDLRQFANDKHNKVDDYPFAHKKGMLLKADVLIPAIKSILGHESAQIIYTSPKGKQLTHDLAKELGEANQDIIMIIGYYEGVDERIFDAFNVTSISVGDYILTSGELPAMTIVESLVRYLPGVLGNKECITEESVMSGVLEAPQYTQPREVEGMSVPDVLLSGHHENVALWEREKALEQTLFKRPDLFAKLEASKTDTQLTTKIINNR